MILVWYLLVYNKFNTTITVVIFVYANNIYIRRNREIAVKLIEIT